jgi:hypothetical protein
VSILARSRNLRSIATIATPKSKLDAALGVFSEDFLKSKNALHRKASFSRRKRGFFKPSFCRRAFYNDHLVARHLARVALAAEKSRLAFLCVIRVIRAIRG